MDVAYLFSSGVLATTLEIHLLEFGFSHFFIGLCFVMQNFTYFTLAVSIGNLSKVIDERNIMVIGTIFLGISYLMLGPCTYIFPKNAIVVVLALPVSGIGQALVYCNGIYSI